MGQRTFYGEPLKWVERHKNYSGDQCLKWPYATGSNGYGHIKVNGKTMDAHRFMCISAHGDPPSDRPVAAHFCGKGSFGCVNPNHLRWATAKENSADKKIHGTESQGERNWRTKLTEVQVLEICAARDAGVANFVSAKKYNVSRTVVSHIVTGRSWSWLTGRKLRED